MHPSDTLLACLLLEPAAALACARMLGTASAEGQVGCGLSRFLPADVVAPEGAAAVPAGGGAHRKQRLQQPDSVEIAVELALARVPDRGGPALQDVMRDIGRTWEAEQVQGATQRALQQAQRKRLARLRRATLDVVDGRWPPSATRCRCMAWSTTRSTASCAATTARALAARR